MFAAPALLLASALAQGAEVPPVEPYRCGVSFEIAGLSGGMWRDFYPGHPDDFTIIQLQNPEVDQTSFVSWRIDNRPPAPPRVYGWHYGRPEAAVFGQGPDYVSFGTVTYGEVADGPIWVRLYGDGVYAGQYVAQTPRRTRQAHRRGGRSLSFSVTQMHHPEIVASLASAREWRAVLLDGAGRELGSRTVHVPLPAEVQAAFARARAQMMIDRADYLTHPGSAEDGPPCTRLLTDAETI
jgi:hypothetical protein